MTPVMEYKIISSPEAEIDRELDAFAARIVSGELSEEDHQAYVSLQERRSTLMIPTGLRKRSRRRALVGIRIHERNRKMAIAD